MKDVVAIQYAPCLGQAQRAPPRHPGIVSIQERQVTADAKSPGLAAMSTRIILVVERLDAIPLDFECVGGVTVERRNL